MAQKNLTYAEWCFRGALMAGVTNAVVGFVSATLGVAVLPDDDGQLRSTETAGEILGCAFSYLLLSSVAVLLSGVIFYWLLYGLEEQQWCVWAYDKEDFVASILFLGVTAVPLLVVLIVRLSTGRTGAHDASYTLMVGVCTIWLFWAVRGYSIQTVGRFL